MANTFITEMCLAYLLHFDTQVLNLHVGCMYELPNYPLSRYAVKYWAQYACFRYMFLATPGRATPLKMTWVTIFTTPPSLGWNFLCNYCLRRVQTSMQWEVDAALHSR
ncbi:hypothetical protein JB92DRAFT_2833851 [Gautieria morchelliformis]|nr:hypothetical protein JB92DRAFT_2833851 [Gautieria morchelliformis]